MLDPPAAASVFCFSGVALPDAANGSEIYTFVYTCLLLLTGYRPYRVAKATVHTHGKCVHTQLCR